MKKIIGLMLLIAALLYILNSFDILFGSSTENEIHYLPDGFIGKVLIVFDQPNGTIKEKQVARRIYKIPENGILISQYKAKPGWVSSPDNLLFYYVDSLGNPIRAIPYIHMIDPDSISRRSDIGVYYMFYSTVNIDGEEVSFKRYIVDTLNVIRNKYPPTVWELPKIKKALEAIK